MAGLGLLNIGTALGGLTSGYQQAQNNALRQRLGQLEYANALQQLQQNNLKFQQQQQMQQAGPVAWQALQQLGGGGQNPFAGLSGIGGGGTQAITPPTPQINVMPPMQQASMPSYSDGSGDTSAPPPVDMTPDALAAAERKAAAQGLPIPPGAPGFPQGANLSGPPPSADTPRAPSVYDGARLLSVTGNLVPGGAMSLGNVLDTISRDESGGRNILQTAYSGAPGSINPSTGTHTAPSSASGLYQITNQTWRNWAPRVGVDLRQYPTAMSAPPEVQRKVAAYGLQSEGLGPWAPYNPKLRADLGVGGGQTNPVVHIQQAGGKTAADAASMLPQQLFGQFSIPTIVKAIDKANPDAPALVKFEALQQLMKIMNPEDRMQTQMMLLQNREQFQMEIEALRTQNQQNLLNQRQDFSQQELNQRQSMQGWQIGSVDAPDPQHPGQTIKVPVRMNTATGEVQPLQLPQGATNLTHLPGGGGAGSQLPPGWTDADTEYWANVIKNGGALPPGAARSTAVVARIMAKVPGAGDTDPGQFIANHSVVKADSSSLTNLTKMTDAAESFEKTATKNFDLALSQAKDAVPTDSGPWLNKWVETGETQFGDENVPPYTAALLTAANEYAKIMSGSTGSQGSTVDSRREAAELFSPYLNAGQIARVVAIAKQDMANRKASLYGQVDEVKQRLKTAGSNKPTAEQGETQPQAPAVGTVQGGYRFKGGDPADASNWEPAQ